MHGDSTAVPPQCRCFEGTAVRDGHVVSYPLYRTSTPRPCPTCGRCPTCGQGGVSIKIVDPHPTDPIPVVFNT